MSSSPSPGKKKSHCIGKGRRLTLKELQAIASGEATVEWYQPGAETAEADAPPPSSDVFVLDQTVMADRVAKHASNNIAAEVLLSTEESSATATLLALNISQGRLLPPTAQQEEAHLVQSIVLLVQTVSNTALRLPRDAAALWSALPSLLLVQPSHANTNDALAPFLWKSEHATAVTAVVDRVVWMATQGLAVARAVSLAHLALPVACLSVERYGASAVWDEYAERRFDQLRPHRGLIAAAATLRAVLNGSKFVIPSEEDFKKKHMRGISIAQAKNKYYVRKAYYGLPSSAEERHDTYSVQDFLQEEEASIQDVSDERFDGHDNIETPQPVTTSNPVTAPFSYVDRIHQDSRINTMYQWSDDDDKENDDDDDTPSLIALADLDAIDFARLTIQDEEHTKSKTEDIPVRTDFLSSEDWENEDYEVQVTTTIDRSIASIPSKNDFQKKHMKGISITQAKNKEHVLQTTYGLPSSAGQWRDTISAQDFLQEEEASIPYSSEEKAVLQDLPGLEVIPEEILTVNTKSPTVHTKTVPGMAAALQAVKDLPQYHGPAQETLQQAHKTLELELNCFDVGLTERPLDRTVAELALAQAARAVQVLARASRVRVDAGNAVSQDETGAAAAAVTIDLAPNVLALQAALQYEARFTTALLQQHMDVATEEARQKEAVKAERAAALQQQQSGGNDQDDEFAGKTQAQIAKIVAARAKKEAKAKAKAAAKQASKGDGAAAVALFGTGTQSLLPLLQADDFQLSQACLGPVQTLLEQLLSGGVQRKPKIPKGTRDYLPDQMRIRQTAFSIIRRVFQSHGAVEIDTPVFELKDTLTGKYGEDSKLIYDLADQGGELLALRYDLTVPFARFLALNSVGNIKRYHIGKVYRRDQPALARGRYREFYQCDFDIAGVYGRMVPDSECLCVVCEILDSLDIGSFGIKINHRRLLDAILDICGVPADKFRTICSAVDKLDKEPWEVVKREMVDEKGLASEVADKIGTFVLNRGEPNAMYKELMESKKFGNHEGAMNAMEDLRILFEYLEAMDKLKFISFDLSLARGLDYYTGVIYEAVCMSGNTQVGSIGGGGRYDNLASMFQEAGKQTPCVGVSVGIERVFTLMEAKLREEQGGSIKKPNVDVVVASIGEGMLKERMRLAKILWDAKISAEYSQQESPKLNAQLRNALDREIPFMLIIGEQELAENKCKVKDLRANEEELVPIADAVKTLRRRGVIPVGCEFAAELEALEKRS